MPPEPDSATPHPAAADSGAAVPTDAVALSLMAECYQELRVMAYDLMRYRTGYTLQPTALVHEAFFKLVVGGVLSPEGTATLNDLARAGDNGPGPDLLIDDHREHFLALCARTMRQVLADAARRRQRLKRSPPGTRVDLDTATAEAPGPRSQPRPEPAVDVEVLDRALSDLEQTDPRAASLVELRFFGGFSVERAAARLGMSRSTAEADWRYARAWLTDRIGTPLPSEIDFTHDTEPARV